MAGQTLIWMHMRKGTPSIVCVFYIEREGEKEREEVLAYN